MKILGGKYRAEPSALPWNDEINTFLNSASADRKFVVTSRSDVMKAADLKTLDKRYTIELVGEHYLKTDRDTLFENRLKALPRGMQLSALKYKDTVIKDLLLPLEIDRFFGGANWEAMALESEVAFNALSLTQTEPRKEDSSPDYTGTTITNQIEQRRGQQFFRRAVLVSYNSSCCITGNPIERLLTASHIIPWSTSAKDRLNPANGLCLAKTQDTAFDAGLITIDSDLRLVLSKSLNDTTPLPPRSTAFAS